MAYWTVSGVAARPYYFAPTTMRTMQDDADDNDGDAIATGTASGAG